MQFNRNIIEQKINQYITLKMENGRTHIYVNGHRFIQCIRLILNIPRNDAHIYDEIESIDEAAKLYSTHLFQNRILQRPRIPDFRSQGHGITPEQEFWGHCSNIQAWVEHQYDTRVLMSNISFPLLRVLSEAGDPLAKKVFREEIAQRLESGHPSVVQYLINQGYMKHFTPTEFKTIFETTSLIKNLSSQPKLLKYFLQSCVSKFPSLLGEILLKILKLPEGKKILITTISTKSMIRDFRVPLRFNPRFLPEIKNALMDIFNKIEEDLRVDILDCIQAIDNNKELQDINIPTTLRRRYLELMRNRILGNGDNDNIEERLQLERIFLDQRKKSQSKCSYCRKVLRKGQITCDWCGHRRDDDDDFFPYPYIFKPPGGGGRFKEGAIVIPVRA